MHKTINHPPIKESESLPADFMFQLTTEEIKVLTSQFAMSKNGWQSFVAAESDESQTKKG